MPEVRPFAAIRFDFDQTGGDLSEVLAPPYDVLDQRDKETLLSRNDRNIVAVDLPHVPPKSAGPVEVYQRSAGLLRQWLADGTLIRETSPALYLYHQRFKHAGQSYTRRMFIARVRLSPFSEGAVLPHERTFGGPKEDRLALMKSTQCQLSPILGLYTDPQNRVGQAFAAEAVRKPDAVGSLDGVDNLLWIVTDGSVIDTVASAMVDKKVYIADGHHRYGTALLYRDFLIQRHGGAWPDDHPANFVMFVLASMDDPGCLILPYHRVLAGIDLGTVLAAWSEGTAPVSNGEADIVLYDGKTGRETPLRFTHRTVLATLEPGQPAAWCKLDYAYLHRYLIDELLGKQRSTGAKPDVHYLKSAEDAKRAARELPGVALLMNATPLAHLRAVSEGGGLMPQKSTYFYPKLATGLAINPLTERLP